MKRKDSTILLAAENFITISSLVFLDNYRPIKIKYRCGVCRGGLKIEISTDFAFLLVARKVYLRMATCDPQIELGVSYIHYSLCLELENFAVKKNDNREGET